jgi:uncharacterized protein YbaP (TraB family)
MENRSKKFGRLLFFFLFLAAIGPWAYIQDALAQNEKSFIWRVGADGSTIHILGSIHFLKKENYPLPPKIEKAFDEADTLVVEANINDESKINPAMIMERAFYPESDTLQAHVSKETFEEIHREAGGLGIPPEQINRCRPWFLAVTISSLEFMKLGYDPRYGIDYYFLAKAANLKRVLELESLDYQIKILSGLSDMEQELFLLYTLKDLKIAGQEFDQLFKAWVSGDSQGMESIMMKYTKEDSRLSSAYQKLVYERNINMAEKIEGYLRTKGNYFVIIGAAHLVGEKGIIEILRGKGYRVVQF